jgi:hypothetical protein
MRIHECPDWSARLSVLILKASRTKEYFSFLAVTVLRPSLGRKEMKELAAFILMAASLLNPVCHGQNQSSSKPASEAPKNSNASLIQNGDFSRGLESWLIIGQGVNSYHPEDPGRAGFSVQNGVLRIDIRNDGISIWSVMLYQSTQFEKGATYTVSFRAKSDYETEIVANVVQDVTYKDFSGDRKFKLAGAMHDYSYQFTMSEDGPAVVQFCLGKAGTWAMYFSDIAVRKN